MMENDRCVSRIVHQEQVEAARKNELELREIDVISRLLKAFGDPGRLRILHALLFQEMCVCDLAALLDVSESAVSHQLRHLRTMRLVTNRREGTVLYYRPANKRLAEMIELSRSIAGEISAQ